MANSSCREAHASKKTRGQTKDEGINSQQFKKTKEG
jgi:hypothetical protein